MPTKKLVILFGPPAVGKMTVGEALEKRTGLKLFHNHMTIELVIRFFPFGSPKFETLVGEFRRRIIEEVVNSDLPGLIFTYVWALDQAGDKRFIDDLGQICTDKGGELYYVELEASLAERLQRNRSPYRLAQKPTKRDVEASEKRLLQNDKHYQLNSKDDFFYSHNYLKVDNTHLSPDEAAQYILTTLSL